MHYCSRLFLNYFLFWFLTSTIWYRHTSFSPKSKIQKLTLQFELLRLPLRRSAQLPSFYFQSYFHLPCKMKYFHIYYFVSWFVPKASDFLFSARYGFLCSIQTCLCRSEHARSAYQSGKVCFASQTDFKRVCPFERTASNANG